MTHETWVRDVLRPAIMATMAACVAWSIAEFIRLLWPAWNLPWTVLSCTLAALEAHFSYRLLRSRPIFMTDRWRVRAFELAFLFVLIKAGVYVGAPLDAILADLRTWANTPIAIFDPQTIVNYLLALAALFAVTDTTADLEELRDPEAPLREISPREELLNRYFWAGLILLFASGLARIGFVALLNLGRGAVTGLVANALIYFMLGLVLMGQANYAHWAAVWQYEGTPVNDALPGRWARHSLIFLLIIALIAFSLPTFYGLGLLDVLGTLITVIGFVLYLIAFLISALIVGLFSSFAPRGQEPVPPPVITAVPTPQPLPTPPLDTPLPLDPLWEFWRSTTFWVFIALLVAYILFEYLSDRPELLRGLKNARLFRRLRELWHSLRSTALGWMEAVRVAIRESRPLERLRQWISRTPLSQLPFWNLRRASPREQIWYYYLSTLRRAAQLGFGRAPAQTPDEYDPLLEAQLAEAQTEVHALTEAFDHARYNPEPIEKEKAKATKEIWEKVRAALHRLRQRMDDK
ncbi:MAG: DUF4129 domain-containing protein [Anaerolineales bacterium]